MSDFFTNKRLYQICLGSLSLMLLLTVIFVIAGVAHPGSVYHMEGYQMAGDTVYINLLYAIACSGSKCVSGWLPSDSDPMMRCTLIVGIWSIVAQCIIGLIALWTVRSVMSKQNSTKQQQQTSLGLIGFAVLVSMIALIVWSEECQRNSLLRLLRPGVGFILQVVNFVILFIGAVSLGFYYRTFQQSQTEGSSELGTSLVHSVQHLPAVSNVPYQPSDAQKYAQV